MKKNLFIIIALLIVFVSCSDSDTHTSDYGILQVKGTVQSRSGDPLANVQITATGLFTRDGETLESASFTATSTANGSYLISGEISNLEGFVFTLSANEPTNRYSPADTIISVVPADFAGSRTSDKYYKGTAAVTRDFILDMNLLN
ncbi:MAG: carboxypeptidase-like regulatory domain-containing protein [Bacteroidales bacterium]|jgi:hypothetical protein|nr:carboxypeptidase-like regulatory domain-containing protein [Bacteroidales bacterium]